MCKIKKQVIMFISFLFILIAFINTVSADQSMIYVNDSGGNDEWNGQYATWQSGTLFGPKKSIKNATGAVADGGTIKIAEGLYAGENNTNITIDKNMTIIGQSREGTIINGTDSAQIFIIQSGKNVTIMNLTFTNCTASDNETDGYGGAIDNNGNLTVENCIFTGNIGTFGGAINNEENLTVKGSAFIYNAAYGGGAIANTGTLTIIDSGFVFNSADTGGAIYNRGNFVISSDFISNFATIGGAIYNDGNITITSGNFTDNIAINDIGNDNCGNGGAIYNDGTLNVNNSIFTNNIAYSEASGDYCSDGGGIYNNGNLTINNSTFANNSAVNDYTDGYSTYGYAYGGAIYNNHYGIVTVNDSTFIDNTAASEGGAIFTWDILTVNCSNFTGNHAKFGGAISSYSSIAVNNCTFTNNAATGPEYGYGGAINSNSTLTVNTSAFINNTATTNGGAIDNEGACTINGTSFINNIANGTGPYNGGGAIYHISVNLPLIIHFSSFFGNNALNGYNIHCTGLATLLDADYNWWGSNNGPQGIISSYGELNSWPTKWFVLNVTASPNLINKNTISTITADLTHDNQGTYHNPTDGHIPDGIVVNFETTLGTINDSSTVNGTAQSTLNGGSVDGVANVSVELDAETKQTSVNVYDAFTIAQIKQAAATVKTYIETYSGLPETVTINGTSINMAQFLELLMTATLQLNSGNTNSILLRTYNAPANPIDDIKTGNIFKAEYLKIAGDLKTYMDTTGRTPDYQYQTSLGIHLGFQNLIYMYSKILNYHEINGALPNYASMNPWSTISGQSAGIIPNGPTFTIDQIKDAAATVKNYIEAQQKLPDTITINGTTINMAQFLELLMTATLQLNSGNTNPIPLRTYNAPAGPIDDITAGNILKTEYLKIAGDLKSYMDTTGRTPDYQYQTSLGVHLGYQNLIYMYSQVLDYHKTNGVLPSYIVMESWRFVSSPTLANFTITQIKDAATTVKTYIDTYYTLPNNVTINGITVSMSQFLELLMNATLQISNGTNNPILLKNYSAPTNPIDDIKTGNIIKTEYLKIANDLKTYMHNTGKTPDYQYQTSLGIHLGFQNLIYMYSKVLDYHKTNGKLPDYSAMKPWATINSQSAGIIPNGPKFTIDQIKDAATTVNTYIDMYYKLPDTVTINGTSINMAQFLELLMTATLQLNTGNTNLIPLKNFSDPAKPIDDIKAGNIFQAEYLKIAGDLKTYMDTTGRTPDYQYQTSLGVHLGFQNLIYMYSQVLDYHKINGVLPNNTAMKPWSTITIQSTAIIPNGPTFTIDQIKDAATRVKTYVEDQLRLPNYVDINGINVSMSQFLELLMTATLQLNNGNTNPIPLRTYNAPINPVDDITAGNILKTEYLKIANDLKTYMDTTGRTPDYQYQTSLGIHLGFQNLIYMYSKILDYHKTNGALPSYTIMDSWKSVTRPTLATFTIDDIEDAASRVKAYVENELRLPNYVTILGILKGQSSKTEIQVSMSQFLELLMTATLQINNGTNNPLALKEYIDPTNPIDDICSGNILKAEYLQIANDLKCYMDNTTRTPDYQYQTSLGTHLGFENLIYMYSKILDYHKTNGTLPNYASMKPWAVVTGQASGTPSDLLQYLQSTANCDITNAQINALSWSLAQGGNGLEAATAIFHWVRDNLGYSFYYNTKYGAVGTLNNGSGNCCDHTHLLVALLRATGIPARYVHGTCTFSSGTYGHVWAEVYVNGQWYWADATSTRNELGVIKNWNTATYIYKGTYASLPF